MSQTPWWKGPVYAVMLLVFFDLKARREEQWLKEKFPDYGAYQKRVRKLIPFIYIFLTIEFIGNKY